jgi:hypothetical protein
MAVGFEIIVTALQKLDEFPQLFFAFTQTSPATAAEPIFTVMEVVFCPDKIERPVGNVQVYVVVPNTATVEKTTVSVLHNCVSPFITVGTDGFPFIVLVRALLAPQTLEATTEIEPVLNEFVKDTLIVFVP